MRRENSAVGWGEPRGELARAALVRRNTRDVYTPNGVLDMTRRRITHKTLFAQGGYLRVHAWRRP